MAAIGFNSAIQRPEAFARTFTRCLPKEIKIDSLGSAVPHTGIFCPCCKTMFDESTWGVDNCACAIILESNTPRIHNKVRKINFIPTNLYYQYVSGIPLKHYFSQTLIHFPPQMLCRFFIKMKSVIQ